MNMAKYRKKPIVVEAEQWFPDKPVEGVIFPAFQQDKSLANCGGIITLEGKHIVSPGDWIITGVKKEKYPCKPDIFAETYEMV